jgi:phosphatidylserine/phosphatidylglycerophosphate/cardiolipin synthase-like enzyme
VKLIIEPEAGVGPLLAAIARAKKSVEIAIFRFDRRDIEIALKAAAAAKRVGVTAVIAFANRGGEQNLRRLESRFLDAGIIVARSASDLSRYHGKYILIDRRELYVLSFNFTHLDIDHSRGFGIVTTNANWIREAIRLFEADCTHTPYVPARKTDTFVVSPTNSRRVLGTFLQGAKTQLLIYDPKISDPEMLRILHDRAKAGVEIKIIGTVAGRTGFDVQKLGGTRLHTRTIIRDRQQAFVGSQSLRRAELDSRREVGLIVRDAPVVRKLIETFEGDWTSTSASKALAAPRETDSPRRQPAAAPEAVVVSDKDAQKAVQILTKELDPLAVSVKKAVRVAVAKVGDAVLGDKDVKDTMKKVVKKAVKDAVKEAVKDAVSDADAARSES